MTQPTIPESITHVNARELAARGSAAFATDGQIALASLKTCDSSALAVFLQWRRAQAATNTKPVEFLAVPHNVRQLARLYGVESLLFAA